LPVGSGNSATVQVHPPRRGRASQPPGEVAAAPRAIDDELAAIVVERRAGDRGHPAGAHELARLLVMDGRWPAVRRFADGYEQRCGDDPIVRTWG
jgi:hypothetical protein